MTDQNNATLILASIFYCNGMTKSALAEIIETGQVGDYPAHHVIFREGEPSAGVHVLLNGQVNLLKVGLQGIESIVHVIKPVTIFNEISAIDQKGNPVTAITEQESVTWQVSPARFKALAQRHPEFGYRIMEIMAERNRVLLNCYEDLISRPVLARTAKLLLSLSKGGYYPINRYEHPNLKIAAMAATVPEAVSRSIKTLKENQVIGCTRAQIRIISREVLTQYAQVEPRLPEPYSSLEL